MHLNTLAGRSYNDLMQYPVFPFILADYDSDFIDLNDTTSFRDLSKPMGAQSSGRLNQFIKRYKEWDDPHNETPRLVLLIQSISQPIFIIFSEIISNDLD